MTTDTITEAFGLIADPGELLEIRTLADDLHADLESFAARFGALAERFLEVRGRVRELKQASFRRIADACDVELMDPDELARFDEAVSTIVDIVSGYSRVQSGFFDVGEAVNPESIVHNAAVEVQG